MFQVQCLNYTQNKITEVYGKYCLGPFFKGQSITMGHTLRRVLLSNLQSLAITGVRIKGSDADFATTLNIKEDLVDLLLNLKQVILKGEITEPTLAILNVIEPGSILAKDIELPKNIELVDPEQYIASVTTKRSIKMEFIITKGQNYFTSDKLNSTIPDSFIGIDAVFMPVTKVKFFIEPSPDPKLESLLIEIWTNGSIMPNEALTSAAKILETNFRLLKLKNISSVPSSSIPARVQKKT